MKTKVGFVIAVILGLFLVYVALESPDYTVSRSTLIHAPADKIFPYLNSTKLAEKWGPWSAEDPDAKMTFSGPEAGVGSKTSWTGGKHLGTGSATIVESIPNQKVGVRLEFEGPMAMTQDSTYALQAQGADSLMTWEVRGKNSFMGRLMCHFVNMDKMVGSMFERGLENLKTLVEKGNPG